MTDSLRARPWFAIAFGLYPFAYVAAANPGQVEAATLVLALAAAAVVCGVLLALLRPLLGDWQRAGLGVAWFLLLFFSYGSINALFDDAGRDADEGVAILGWAARNLQLVHSVV